MSAEPRDVCREMLERISAYLDGDLQAAECHAIEVHCRECPQCHKVVDELRRTIGLCRDVGAAPLPEFVRNRARASVRELLSARKSSQVRRKR